MNYINDFNKTSVYDISRYIINRGILFNNPVENLKLQKLLYLIQIEYIEKYGDVLFNEKIEVWRHGPVVRESYERFKVYGTSPIRKRQDQVDIFNLDTLQLESKYNPPEFTIPFKEMNVINDVFDRYIKTQAWDLVDICLEDHVIKNALVNNRKTLDLDLLIQVMEN